MKPPNLLSRRGFIGGSMLAGLGALVSDPMAAAQVLVSGKTAEDIQGHGMKAGIVNLSSSTKGCRYSQLARSRERNRKSSAR